MSNCAHLVDVHWCKMQESAPCDKRTISDVHVFFYHPSYGVPNVQCSSNEEEKHRQSRPNDNTERSHERKGNNKPSKTVDTNRKKKTKGDKHANDGATNKQYRRKKSRKLSVVLPSVNDDRDDTDHTDTDTSSDNTSVHAEDDYQSKTDNEDSTSNNVSANHGKGNGDITSEKTGTNISDQTENKAECSDIDASASKDNDKDSGNNSFISESEDAEDHKENTSTSDNSEQSVSNETNIHESGEETVEQTPYGIEDTGNTLNSPGQERNVTSESPTKEQRSDADQNDVHQHKDTQTDTDTTIGHTVLHSSENLPQCEPGPKEKGETKNTSSIHGHDNGKTQCGVGDDRDDIKPDIPSNTASHNKTTQHRPRKQMRSNSKTPKTNSRTVKKKHSVPKTKKPACKRSKEHNEKKQDIIPASDTDGDVTDSSEDDVSVLADTTRPKTANTATQCNSPQLTGDTEALLDDCVRLREALCGKKVDKDTVNSIIARRDLAQRLRIRTAYTERYGRTQKPASACDPELQLQWNLSKPDTLGCPLWLQYTPYDIVDDVQCELRGDHRDLVRALFQDHVTMDASLLRYAVKGLGTNEAALIHVLASRPAEAIQSIKVCYSELYGHDVKDDVKGDTSGSFQIFCLVLLDKEEHVADDRQDDTEEEARAIWRPGERVTQGHENTFIEILSSFNKEQFQAVSSIYEKISGVSITDAIKKCSRGGDVQDGLLATVAYLTDSATYHAETIHKALKGFRRNDRLLINVIVTTMDTDLADIEAAYNKLYNRSLISAISAACGGHYGNLLQEIVAQCGHEAPPKVKE